MKKQSYEDLEVYRMALELAKEIHSLTLKSLPPHELYEEGSQIRRSSKSVVSTIVEGFGRKQYQQEYAKFLTYALASCDETKVHLAMLFETGSFKDQKQYDHLIEEYRTLGKRLYSLREAIVSRLRLSKK